MGFIWHEPRKRILSTEPRISISQQFLSLNKACIDEHFKDTDRVKIGYDESTNKLILVPLARGDTGGMKIIENQNSTSRYINAGRIFKNFKLVDADNKVKEEFRGDYKCSWDSVNNGVLVDLKNDKVK